MAIIGVSKPKFAKYKNENGIVTYSEGGSLGKMTEVNIEIDSNEDNNLYGDNGIAETDRQFVGGTVTLSTTDLSQEVSKAILGVIEQDLEEIEGIEDTEVKELIYDDRQEIPYLGIGIIIKKQVNNVILWRAVVLTKVMFAVPADAATTQGESIDWQVTELSSTIMKDDTPNHMWKREATFTTEAQAEKYIDTRLGIAKAQATSFSLNK